MSNGYDPLVRERAYFSGEQLHGDDLAGQDLADWFASEESGYHDIRTQQDIRARQGSTFMGFTMLTIGTGTVI